MSVAVDRQALDLLLRVMETPAAKAQASALRIAGSRATDTLLSAGLLAGSGDVPVIAAMDGYEDEPIEVEWSPEHRCHGYRDSTGRWIKVRPEEIATFGVDFQRAIAGMLMQFDRTGSPPPKTLIEGLLLDVGVIRLTGAKAPVPVWFARRLSDADVWQKVSDLMRRRPAEEARVILTSTDGDLLMEPGRRDIVVSISDVLAVPGDLAISPRMLGARVFPGQAQRRYPIDHSENYGVVWLRDQAMEFGGDKQRAFLGLLFDAYWSDKPVLRTADVLSDAGFKGGTNSVSKAFSGREDYKQFIRQSEGNIWIEP
jgi:hypothetical protein